MTVRRKVKTKRATSSGLAGHKQHKPKKVISLPGSTHYHKQRDVKHKHMKYLLKKARN